MAILSPDGKLLTTIKFKHASARDVRTALAVYEVRRAYVEKVGATPQMGVTSAFTFGHVTGWIEGMLDALLIPWERVQPKAWQKVIGMTGKEFKGISQAERKRKHKAKAQQLFPQETITHATADAILIAEAMRRRDK